MLWCHSSPSNQCIAITHPCCCCYYCCFAHPMECQPTPPLDEMDPDTLVEETNNKSSSRSSTSSNSSTSSSNALLLDENSSTTADEQETADEQPLTQYHAKNYFNSTMVERIYDFCLPWLLVAIHVSYQITTIHHSPSPRRITQK